MKKIMLGGMMAALLMVALAVAPAHGENDVATEFARYVADHVADINGEGTVVKTAESYAGVGGKTVLKTIYRYFNAPQCNWFFAEEGDREGAIITAEMKVSAEFEEKDDGLEYKIIGLWMVVHSWESRNGDKVLRELRMLDLDGDMKVDNVFFVTFSKGKDDAEKKMAPAESIEPDATLQALFEALVRRMAAQAENIGKPRI